MKKPHPMMGELVIVVETFVKQKFGSHTRQKIIKLDKPRTGWFVGTSFVHEGNVVVEDGYSTFQSTKRTPCARVVFWHNVNPVNVPMDNLRYAGPNSPPPISPMQAETEHYREFLPTLDKYNRDWQKEAMKDWPRDSHGRWIKK